VTERALVVMVGKAGSGKTTQLRAYVSACRRALIADPENDWQLQPGDELVESHTALLERVQQLGATNPAVPFRLVYRDDAPRLAVAAPAVAYAVRNLTLVYDELVWLCHAHYLPDWFRRVLQVGRKRRINLIGTTREPQEIHDMLFSQANLVHFFRVDPGNGLDRITRRYPAIAAELATLEDHASKVWGDPRVVELLGREGLDSRRKPSVLSDRS
jgi:hypothetical protein